MDSKQEEEASPAVRFHEMGLDERILEAIAHLGWLSPTLIQEKAIPLVMEGRDVLARARTGSGKTGAYAIPLVHNILSHKQIAEKQETWGLVLTPSKELCEQANRNIKEVSAYCGGELSCVDVSGQASAENTKSALSRRPDVVVGPPSRVLSHIESGTLIVNSLRMLVIDEADLVFSFGHEEDLKKLLSKLPTTYQSILMSATLSADVKTLKRLVLHNPVTLKLEEAQLPDTTQLTQYHINCEEEDKFVLIYALLKLRLIRGKSLIFVKDVTRSFKLKLFLQQFGIRTCVLNSELPVNSRCHIVSQFNSGVYDNIIASDEQSFDLTTTDVDSSKKKRRKRRKKKTDDAPTDKDSEYGVSRGIDFQFVSNVVNFDFPPTVDSYIHRVGRTARGDSTGTALSFISSRERPMLKQVETTLKDAYPDGEDVFKPFNFKMSEIEGFRYRAKDALKAVTTIAVKEARIREIRSEMLQSEKLKTFFEKNPRDYQAIRHDLKMKGLRAGMNLPDVPEYLVPQTLRQLKRPGTTKSKKKPTHRKKRPAADPLQSFKFSGLDSKKKRK